MVKLWLIQRGLGGQGQRALAHGRGTLCMPHASFTPLPTPSHTHYYAMPMETGELWELVDAVAGRKPAGGPFVVQ